MPFVSQCHSRPTSYEVQLTVLPATCGPSPVCITSLSSAVPTLQAGSRLHGSVCSPTAVLPPVMLPLARHTAQAPRAPQSGLSDDDVSRLAAALLLQLQGTPQSPAEASLVKQISAELQDPPDQPAQASAGERTIVECSGVGGCTECS